MAKVVGLGIAIQAANEKYNRGVQQSAQATKKLTDAVNQAAVGANNWNRVTAKGAQQLDLHNRAGRRGLQGMLELSRAAEDMTVVWGTQGLTGAIRASTNNLTQFFTVFGGPFAGAVAGFVAAGGTVLFNWWQSTKKATEEATEATNNYITSLERLKKRQQGRQIILESRAKGVTGHAEELGGGLGKERENLRDLREQRSELVRLRTDATKKFLMDIERTAPGRVSPLVAGLRKTGVSKPSREVMQEFFESARTGTSFTMAGRLGDPRQALAQEAETAEEYFKGLKRRVAEIVSGPSNTRAIALAEINAIEQESAKRMARDITQAGVSAPFVGPALQAASPKEAKAFNEMLKFWDDRIEKLDQAADLSRVSVGQLSKELGENILQANRLRMEMSKVGALNIPERLKEETEKRKMLTEAQDKSVDVLTKNLKAEQDRLSDLISAGSDLQEQLRKMALIRGQFTGAARTELDKAEKTVREQLADVQKEIRGTIFGANVLQSALPAARQREQAEADKKRQKEEQKFAEQEARKAEQEARKLDAERRKIHTLQRQLIGGLDTPASKRLLAQDTLRQRLEQIGGSGVLTRGQKLQSAILAVKDYQKEVQGLGTTTTAATAIAAPQVGDIREVSTIRDILSRTRAPKDEAQTTNEKLTVSIEVLREIMKILGTIEKNKTVISASPITPGMPAPADGTGLPRDVRRK